MSEKKCNKCNKLKQYPEFSKCYSNNDSLQYTCKLCSKAARKVYGHTRDGLIACILSQQVHKSKERGHPPPKYNLSELRNWVNKQASFDALYLKWVNSGYKKRLVPSIDRADDYKGYSFDNILRICTWQENRHRGHVDRKNGINNKQSKAVRQVTIGGKTVAEFYSQSEASRQTGIKQGSISNCCIGRANIAGGFRWENT